jgi:hypothetical protein
MPHQRRDWAYRGITGATRKVAALLARRVALRNIPGFGICLTLVNEKQVAISTGFMNIDASALGGVPMCHGAGGMAEHIRFGATTGGAPFILGAVLITLALFFGGSRKLPFFPRRTAPERGHTSEVEQ